MAPGWTTGEPGSSDDPVTYRVRMGLTFGPKHPLRGRLPLGVGNSPSMQTRAFATLEEARAYVEGVAKPNVLNGDHGDVVFWSEVVAYRRKVRRSDGRNLGVVTKAECRAPTRLLAWRQPDGSVSWEERPIARGVDWEWVVAPAAVVPAKGPDDRGVSVRLVRRLTSFVRSQRRTPQT
jgi:hypothetical protein